MSRIIEIDQRLLLPDGNIFKRYQPTAKTPIREGAPSCLSFMTVEEIETERLGKKMRRVL